MCVSWGCFAQSDVACRQIIFDGIVKDLNESGTAQDWCQCLKPGYPNRKGWDGCLVAANKFLQSKAAEPIRWELESAPTKQSLGRVCDN